MEKHLEFLKHIIVIVFHHSLRLRNGAVALPILGSIHTAAAESTAPVGCAPKPPSVHSRLDEVTLPVAWGERDDVGHKRNRPVVRRPCCWC